MELEAPLLMIRFKELDKYSIKAKDGDLGVIRDVYFDDSSWNIRYFVLETSRFLSGKKVLLSPANILNIDSDARFFEVGLSRKEIGESPTIADDIPVSLQQDPGQVAPDLHQEVEARPPKGDRHLQSCNAVLGYRLDCADATISGRVTDFLIAAPAWHLGLVAFDDIGLGESRRIFVLPSSVVRDIIFEKQSLLVALSKDDLDNIPKLDKEQYGHYVGQHP